MRRARRGASIVCRRVLIAGFPAGPWGTNCYVAATGPGTECVVIDPGKDAADGVAEVVARAPAQAGRRAGHPRPRRPHVVRRAGRRHVRRHRLDPPRRPAPARQPDGRHERRDDRRCCSAASTSSPSPTSRGARRRPGPRARRPELHRRPHAGPHARARSPSASPYDAEQDISEVMFSGDLLFAGLDRPHRPAGRRPPDDAAQPARPRCCTLRRRHRRAARSRRADVASAASARPTPSCWTSSRRRPSGTSHPRTVSHVQAHAAERVPRVPACRADRRARGPRRALARPSSCTASPTSRPAPSSRSTALAKGGEIDKEIYVLRRLHADDDATATPALGPALRPDRAVRPLRAGERRQARVPVPPLPDPAGLARRAAAGGPVPRVHPGRHRHRRPRRAAVPPRRRGRAGDGRGARRACRCPRSAFQVNNRKLIQGFYRGLGHRRRPRRDPRHRQARQAAGRRRSRALLVETAGATRRAGRAVPGAGDDQRRRHVLRRAGPRPRRRATSCWTTGLAELAAVIDGCADAGRPTTSTVEANLRIARGLDYYTGTVFEIFMAGYERLEVRRRRRPLRRPRHRRPDDVPRRRHLVRRLAARSSRCSPTACSPAAARSRAPCWSRSSTRSRRAGQRRVADRAARAAASRARSPPAAQKFGKQIRYAERRGIPYVWFPQADGSHRGQGHPQRRPGRRRPRHLDPARRGPPTSTIVTHTRSNTVIRTHDAGTLRAERRRPDRHPRRLGGPPPRPRRRRLHRPARGQRRRPGRHPRRGGRAQPAQRVLPQGHRRRSQLRPEGNANPNLPTGEIEVIADRRRGAQRGRAAAVPDRRPRRRGGGGPAQAPLPRPAPQRPERRAPPAQQGQQGRPRRARPTTTSSRSRRRR